MYFIFFMAVVVVSFWGAKTSGKGKIFADYMSKERTTSIKGVFACIIVLSHMLQYLSFQNAADTAARYVIIGIGQLMVTMFFFYSGYGVCESCGKKTGYMKGFFGNRILKTLLHFDLAICLFLLVNFALGKQYPLQRTLLAFTGWTSVGNSNWFVFGMLALYLITLLSFGLLGKRRAAATALTAALCVVLIIFLREEKQSWWYNTLLCYPLGMAWSLARKSVEGLFEKKLWLWWTALLVMIPLTVVGAASDQSGAGYMLAACGFCLFVVLTQMRIKTQNAALYWLGINSFGIYILQRLPMNIMRYFKLNATPELFIPVAFAAALLLAAVFTRATGLIDRLLFAKKGQINNKERNMRDETFADKQSHKENGGARR